MKAHFIEVLQSKLEDRTRRNPVYSLRAFSRDLKMTPSRLSQIMNGHLGLSRKAVGELAKNLDLSSEEQKYFCDSVLSLHARSPIEKQKAQLRLKKYEKDLQVMQISMDQFAVISDWYHFAILELLTLKNCKHEIAWIAEQLDIKETEAQLAIERLLRLGFIKRVKNKIHVQLEMSMTPTDIPSSAIRHFHEQILRKALAALDQQKVGKRDFAATTLAIDTNQLPEIKKELREFRKSLIQKFNLQENKNAVYCLSLQLFSLTNSKENL